MNETGINTGVVLAVLALLTLGMAGAVAATPTASPTESVPTATATATTAIPTATMPTLAGCAPATATAAQESTAAENGTVRIVSPDPSDAFHRGDIVPIELELEGTDTATLAFGDRTTALIEFYVTVRDTNDDGTATVYLNTFQTGDGPVEHPETGEIVEADWVEALRIDRENGTFHPRVGDRNHGVYAGDGTTLVGKDGMEAVAHAESLDVGGGPGGLGVLPAGEYALVAVPGPDHWRTDGVTDPYRTTVTLEDRGSEQMKIWTAPGTGDTGINATAIDDVETIEELRDAGVITPADGTIANQDLKFIQIQSTGLEGLLHETALLHSQLDADRFLRWEGQRDRNVTRAFFSTDYVRAQALGLDPQDEDDRDEAGEILHTGGEERRALCPTILDLEGKAESVLADTDKTGSLNEYWLPMHLEVGNEAVKKGFELTPDKLFETTFHVRPVADDRFLSSTEPFVPIEANDEGEPVSTERTTADWEFLYDWGELEHERETPMLENKTGIEFGGPASVAAGTELTVTLEIGSDREEVIKTNTTVEYVPGELNRWNATGDLGEYNAGSEFEVNLSRSGDSSLLTPFRVPIRGILVEPPRVDELVFPDQESSGRSVVVETFDTTQGGFVVIENVDGERIGTSRLQKLGEQNDVRVGLSPDLEGDQQLRAVAYRTEEQPYVDENGNRITRNATINVLPESASFRVSDVDVVGLDDPETPVTVSATIDNTGDEEGSQTVELRIDEQTTDTQQVTLSAGEETTVEFTLDLSNLAPKTTHVYSVVSDDTDKSAPLTVPARDASTPENAPTATPTPDPTPMPTPTATPGDANEETADTADDDGSGFGVVAATLSVLAAALFVRYRARRR